MKSGNLRLAKLHLALIVVILSSPTCWAHVTLRTDKPLRPGGSAQIYMVVPNEWNADTTQVTLEVPDAFLKAGGRLSRVDFPSGWQVEFQKEDKPDDIYRRETDARSKRNAQASDTNHSLNDSQQKEANALDDMRRKWIKKVTFKGGTIPPDGFKDFLIELQLPDKPGEFRFSADQLYADGKDISWSELVKGAAHPAPAIMIEKESSSVWTPQNLALLFSALAFAISLYGLLAGAKQIKLAL
jgi:uncharacterized protein YcnI